MKKYCNNEMNDPFVLYPRLSNIKSTTNDHIIITTILEYIEQANFSILLCPIIEKNRVSKSRTSYPDDNVVLKKFTREGAFCFFLLLMNTTSFYRNPDYDI